MNEDKERAIDTIFRLEHGVKKRGVNGDFFSTAAAIFTAAEEFRSRGYKWTPEGKHKVVKSQI